MYEEGRDKILKSTKIKCKYGVIYINLVRYGQGSIKIKLSRTFFDRFGNEKFCKLGRFNLQDAILIGEEIICLANAEIQKQNNKIFQLKHNQKFNS